MGRRPCSFQALLSAVLAITALHASPSRADRPRLHLTDVDARDYPTVRAHLSLVEPDGRFVTGRSAADFRILVDGVEQGSAIDLRPFDQAGEPVFVAIVVQTSAAMHDVLDEVRRGVREVASGVSSLHSPDSRVALLSYAQQVTRVAEWGPAEAIEGAAARLVEDAAGTEVHLVDAVRTALDMLDHKSIPDGARRLVVLFSDGIDATGATRRVFADLGRRANLAAAASGRGVVIHTIGHAPFDRTRLRHLGELAHQTNGTERTCRSPQDVSAQLFGVADEIRRQYAATFQSALSFNEGEHLFQVVSDSTSGPLFSEELGVRVVPRPQRERRTIRWGELALWGAMGGAVGLLLLVLRAYLHRARGPSPPLEAEAEVELPHERTELIVLDPGIRLPAVGWLVGLDGHFADRTFRLLPARTLVGAGPQADIRIDDSRVSRRHCEIVFDGCAYHVVDLESANGVVLNNQLTCRSELVDGDVLRLGYLRFKFKALH